MMSMVMVITLGLAFATNATLELGASDKSLLRIQSRALAEGAHELAVKELQAVLSGHSLDETNLGNGKYSYKIENDAGNFTIRATGVVDAMRCTCEALYKNPLTLLHVTHTFGAGTDVNLVEGDNFFWSGLLRFGVTANLSNINGSIIQSAWQNFTIQPNIYSNSTLIAGGGIVPPGSYKGKFLAKENTTISGGFSLTGEMLVEGDLTIDALGGNVSLLSDGEPTVLMVRGRLSILNVSQLQISGSIFVENEIILSNLFNVKALGSLITNQNIMIQMNPSGIASWDFDPRIQQDPPREISGGATQTTLIQSSKNYSYSANTP